MVNQCIVLKIFIINKNNDIGTGEVYFSLANLNILNINLYKNIQITATNILTKKERIKSNSTFFLVY